MNKAAEFWKAIEEDKAMASEMKRFLESTPISSIEEELEAITKFAASKGYEAEAEELALEKAKSRWNALSNDELKNVAGGASDVKQMCFADYLCIAAWNTCAVSNECYDSRWDCAEAVSSGHCRNALDARKDCEHAFVSMP